MRARLAGPGALVVVLGGLYAVADKVMPWNTVQGGLVSRLAAAWGLAAWFLFSAAVLGAFVVRRLTPVGRRDGFWGLSLATGILLYALVHGLLSWLQAVGPRSFVLVPIIFVAIGWRTFLEEVLGARQRLRDAGGFRLSFVELLALAFGAICLFLIFLQTISPDNVNFDAAWYHLRAAERYALHGGQVRADDGDQLLVLPQTASWLYLWAFLWPAGIEDQVRLALLLEFSAVVATLAVIPALARALVPSLPRAASRLSWVAFFFFPNVFIYDTGIMGGADHIVALWAVSVLVLWFQVRRESNWSGWVLLGIHLAGLAAKYTSLFLVVPLALVTLIDWLWRLSREGRAAPKPRRWGPLAAVAVVLLLTTPYWLRNVIWYHNPVYPLASSVFPSTPWIPDARAWMAAYAESTEFSESGSFAHTTTASLKALFNYQTELYTWGFITENQPIFGVGWFLATLAIAFVSPRRRMLLLVALTSLGILIWFNTHQHHMRYLTVLMAPMAAGVGAMAAALWNVRGLSSKLAVAAAVAFHLVAFGNIPFRKTHKLAGMVSPLDIAITYITQKGPRSARLGGWEDLGKKLPPRAVPLVHTALSHLGLGRQSRTDHVTLVFGIGYAHWGSVKETLTQLRKIGVTHLVWTSSNELVDSFTGEAIFLALAQQTINRFNANGMTVGELPSEVSDLQGGIVFAGCPDSPLASGLYTFEALKDPLPPRYHPWRKVDPSRPLAGDWADLYARASVVVMDRACGLTPPPPEFVAMIDENFALGQPRFYVRTSGTVLLDSADSPQRQ